MEMIWCSILLIPVVIFAVVLLRKTKDFVDPFG
jgi:hypothetical protein